LMAETGAKRGFSQERLYMSRHLWFREHRDGVFGEEMLPWAWLFRFG